MLDCLLLQHQPVLVPDEIRLLGVESVALHAALEQVDDVRVVGVLSERQAAAVVHELLELVGLVSAELVDGDLLLLLLNVRIFFLL